MILTVVEMLVLFGFIESPIVIFIPWFPAFYFVIRLLSIERVKDLSSLTVKVIKSSPSFPLILIWISSPSGSIAFGEV